MVPNQGRNTPGGPDEYPDLSACTPEQKHETIFGLIQLTAKEVMRMFYAFGLKTHIECKVVNEPTNEVFEFSFVKVGNAAHPKSNNEWLDPNGDFTDKSGAEILAAAQGKEDVIDPIEFAEWILKEEYYAESGFWWRNAFDKNAKCFTTHQLKDLYKQSK